jgi:hypothetical protein
MALQRQLTEEEWAIISIFTDPILLGEYCRNTNDGSDVKEEWPKVNFKYRWYQKDLLTDKNEYVSLIAGRSVGKCNPITSRVYVYPYGYLSLMDLLRELKESSDLLPIYTVDKNNKLTTRRMVIDKNGYKQVLRIKTSRGHTLDCTLNHPIFTPTGYKNAEDLHVGDDIGVATYLPHFSGQNLFTWEELRWMGYMFSRDRVSAELPLILKFQKNIVELKLIADYMDANFVSNVNGSYSIIRKKGPYKHYATTLLRYLRLKQPEVWGLYRIPLCVKAEKLDNIKVFLEALLSVYADITLEKITLSHRHKTFAYDIQELLLRFGVESRVDEVDERWHIEITEYESIYNLFNSLDIPGVSAKGLKPPQALEKPQPYMRWDHIESIVSRGEKPTFAIYVPDTHNYICDNIFVHNSLMLEDLLIYEAVNSEDVFPMTKESVLVTANQKQMDPILDRVIMRISNSKLLKDFLKGGVNRSKGTLDFPLMGGSNYRLNARIAGSKGENNMVRYRVKIPAPLYSNI